MKHRRDIEGLRALAVIAVLLFHFGVPRTKGGYVGVDVFFVISGFLITSLLVDERVSTGRISLRDFYSRRIRRLLPISAVVLIATAASAVAWLEPTRLANLAHDIKAAAVFSVNFVFARRGTDYLASALPPSPIQHYWSLAVEEQFYMVWAVLIAVVSIGARDIRRRVGATMGVLIVVSLALSVMLSSSDPSWSFFGLHTRAWEMGLGALLAVFYKEAQRISGATRAVIGWIGVAGIAISVTTFGDIVKFSGWIAIIPVLGTASILLAGDDARGGPLVVLGIKPLQWIGARSYSLYMWHWPILIIGEAYAGDQFGAKHKFALLFVTVGLSALGFSFIENPIRRSLTLVTKPGMVFVLGAGAVLSGLVTGVALARYDPSISTGVIAVAPTVVVPTTTTQTATTLSSQTESTGVVASTTTTVAMRPVPISMVNTAPLQAIIDAVATQVVPDNLEPSLLSAENDMPLIYKNDCHQYYDTTIKPNCIFGDINGSITVALWGDSHAAQWFTALNSIAKERHWRLLTLTQGGCPFIDVVPYNVHDAVNFTHCSAWRNNVRKYMIKEGADVVLLSEYYGDRDSIDRDFIKSKVWKQKLPALFDSLRTDGIEPVMLGDTPDPVPSVPECILARRRSIGGCAPRAPTGTVVAIDNVIREATLKAAVSFIEPRRWLCSDDFCPVVVGNILVYRDDHHLSNTVVKWLTPTMADILGPSINAIGAG
ncbi:MAG: acyltransferase [Ilumatobacteraceae bacterium]|nr:acyltransferase [Ilumatobacteraceae bacterium]